MAVTPFRAQIQLVDDKGRATPEFTRFLNQLGMQIGINGVDGGTYGLPGAVPQFTVDAYGKITAINNVPIAIVLAQISNLSALTITLSQISNLASLIINAAQINDPENIPIVLAQITDLASLVISYTQVTGLGTMATQNVGTNFTGDLAGKTTTIVNGIVTSVV